MIGIIPICNSVCTVFQLYVKFLMKFCLQSSSLLILFFPSTSNSKTGTLLESKILRGHLWDNTAFIWSSSLTLHIELYTASRGFPATARLLLIFIVKLFKLRCRLYQNVCRLSLQQGGLLSNEFYRRRQNGLNSLWRLNFTSGFQTPDPPLPIRPCL